MSTDLKDKDDGTLLVEGPASRPVGLSHATQCLNRNSLDLETSNLRSNEPPAQFDFTMESKKPNPWIR
ncbi:hypothetical protein AVEN_243397-1 [Araneus ventricosus]|uniref:Uncharacterized protein n=1 Tax=Araneus ventricosus TaxID=182803 RepID=A0A4Y2SGF6_ARAVE|nr:hypothetical protein AVEN_243397-1 [Araneus ventricosus]